MIYTTLNRIKKHDPCAEGWRKLLKHLGKKAADDEPLALSVILESNGLDDALWCLRSVPEESRRWRLLAVAFARKVHHLMTDPRSLAALDVAEKHANGKATDEELVAAEDAAWDAAGAAAGAAAWAAWAAGAEAGDARAAWAAWAAAGDARAAWAEAGDARAAWAAWAAAGDARAAWAAWAEAWAAARDEQVQMFLAAINEVQS